MTDDPRPLPAVPSTLTPLSDLLAREIRPPTFVVQPFFPSGELTEIVGAHGTFKSTIALDACLSVATGRPWGGFPVEKGRSVFITMEDSACTVARRVRAWLDGVHRNAEIGHAVSDEAAAEHVAGANCSLLTREDAQGIVLTATDSNDMTRARLDVADHVSALAQGASLIVLETGSRLHDGPETNEGFRALVASLERIALTTRAVWAPETLNRGFRKF